MKADGFETHLHRLVSKQGIPGIQYTLVDRDSVLLEYQAGQANLSTTKPVSAQTTFMASSSTKVVTAAAVLQLVERQKVALDSPLAAYYARHPYGEKITIRQLLAQTSGIPNPLPLRWLHLLEEHDRYDEESALQQTMNRHSRLKSPPGERYGYSNISYWLLGKVIESASGERYADYVSQNIFDPLGIDPSMASFEILRPELHATGYQKRLSVPGMLVYLLADRRVLGTAVKGRLAFRPVYMNGPAYGGLICTATGFAVFLQEMLRGTPRLFSAASRDLFLTEQLTNKGHPTGMTPGWRIGRLEHELYYGKPGGGPGFRSNVRIYPRLGLGAAWLANESGVSEQEMNLMSDTLDREWLRRG